MRNPNTPQGVASVIGIPDDFDPPIAVVFAIVSRFARGDGFSQVKRKSVSLSLVTAGEAHYVQDGRSGILLPGDVFIGHKGTSVRFEAPAKGYVHKRTLTFAHNEILDSIIRHTGLWARDTVRPGDTRLVTRLFRDCYRIMKQRRDESLHIVSSKAYRILVELARSLAPQHPAEIRPATDFITTNLEKQLTLEMIAGHVGMSVRHISRLFTLYLGMSPIKYYLEQKMEWGRNLLGNTDMSVKQVAATVGYDDPSYFSAQFKKRFGIPPNHYRLANQ